MEMLCKEHEVVRDSSGECPHCLIQARDDLLLFTKDVWQSFPHKSIGKRGRDLYRRVLELRSKQQSRSLGQGTQVITENTEEQGT